MLIMGVAALTLSLTTTNLFFFFRANIDLVAQHGVMALADGALEELIKLLIYGFLTLSAYIVFKACEKTLVEQFLRK